MARLRLTPIVDASAPQGLEKRKLEEEHTMRRRPTLGLAVLVGVLVAVLLPRLSQAGSAGRRGEIAFSARVHGVSQVFTVRPDGSQLRQVTHGGLQAGQFGLSWSPDGRGLLYTVTERNGIDRIVKSRADGGGATVISPTCTGSCLGDDDPVYSPDGRRIAFERAFGPVVNDNAAFVAVFTMNADGSHLTQLTKTPKGSADQKPQWSPDGSKIAFVHDQPNHQGAIEVMSADGRSIRRLTPLQIDATDPRWSPDGKRILFNTYADAVPYKSANLYAMRADGTNRVALTHYSGGTLQAFADDWSPDGTEIVFRRLAYSGIDTEVGGFYILDLRTKHIRRLTPVRLRYDAKAAWSK